MKNTTKTSAPVDQTVQETEQGKRKRLMREECNWQHIGNVDWDDLDFYLAKCHSKKDKASFDTALRILEALKEQTLGKK